MHVSGFLGKVPVGDKVRVMGVINASPESFYKKSVKVSTKELSKTASEMEEHGADFIDIGAMSTAPYLKTMISADEEIDRIKRAVKAVMESCSLPISVDTPRSKTADVALNLGADIVNDVTGLKHDETMALIVADHDASVIVCAYEKYAVSGDAIKTTINALKKSVKLAKDSGIKPNKIIIDPAIGFFRKKGDHPFFTRMKRMSWIDRDLILINRIQDLHALHKAVCISVSRKSFIGKILNLENPEDRLIGSIATEAICVLNGAHIVRTHNVYETMQAVKIVEAILR